MAIRSEICWPASRVGEALYSLADRSGLAANALPATALSQVSRVADQEDTDIWLEHCAALLGVEIEPFDSPHADISDAIGQAAPALLHWTFDDKEQFLAVLGTKKHCLLVLTPRGELTSVALESVRTTLCHQEEAASGPLADQLLAETGIVGLASFVIYLSVLFLAAVNLIHSRKRMYQYLGLVGMISLVALILEGMSLDSFALPVMWVMTGLVTGAYVLMVREENVSRIPSVDHA